MSSLVCIEVNLPVAGIRLITTQMDNPRYNQDYEYEHDADYDPTYDNYRQSGVTSVGLPASQLALIIGVNAVIALVISIVVVLIAGRQAGPGDIAPSVVEIDTPASAEGVPAGANSNVSPQVDNLPPPLPTQVTPIGTVDYVVEPGDTLSLIAEKFSVPLTDLMVANDLTDKNFIQAGQSLVIPVGGLPPATATFTPAPFSTETPLPFDPPTPLPTNAAVPREPAATVGPSPTPTNPPVATPTLIPTSTPPPFDEINVVISEVIAPADLQRETVVILNRGAGVSVRDWKLAGSSLAIFEFPDVFLFSGGSIRLHTSAGENTASDLYLGQGEAAWEPGKVIILSDDRGIEVSRFAIPNRNN